MKTEETIAALDRGEVRVAEPRGDDWVVNADVQAAILDYFRSRQMEPREVGPFEYHDKIPLKTGYDGLGVRVVPPAVARFGSYLSPGSYFGPSGEGYARLSLVPSLDDCIRAAEILKSVL